MPVGTGTLYYVLREGSTREEQWSWHDVEELCRSGELTALARIFLPDENRWAAIGETRLAATLSRNPRDGGDEPVEEDLARLETEYKAALERVSEDPELLEAQLDAGILAAQLGNRDEARAHFQTVLHRYPFHARTAHEIRRRFSKAEQKAFRYLERPAPVWEDLGELIAAPLARGALYVAVPAALLIGLAWLPLGEVAASAIAFLWCFQVMEHTSRGATRPWEWSRSLKDPWRKLARPALLMSAVVAQLLIVVLAAARAALAAQEQGDVSLWTFISQSPVCLVAGSIVGLLYLPAAMVSIGGFTGPITKTLDPRRLVRTIVRMEHEYVYSVALIAAIGAVLGLLKASIGAVGVAGDVVFGIALAYAVPMCGLILGRLLGRMGHVIE